MVIITAIARFWIRLRIQRQLSFDDGFILIGIGCLTRAIAMFFTFQQKMYVVEDILVGEDPFELAPDFVQEALDYQKWVAISLILLWTAITCVKFQLLVPIREADRSSLSHDCVLVHPLRLHRRRLRLCGGCLHFGMLELLQYYLL